MNAHCRPFDDFSVTDIHPLGIIDPRIPDCQSAFKFDPSSASNFDPFERRGLTVALGSSELARIAETRRARVV